MQRRSEIILITITEKNGGEEDVERKIVVDKECTVVVDSIVRIMEGSQIKRAEPKFQLKLRIPSFAPTSA